MPIRWEDHITRQMVRAEPCALFVYGDNLIHKGMSGQSQEMRGEPNAVGIPIKWLPAIDPAAYFSDTDIDTFWYAAEPLCRQLANHLRSSGVVVWPAAGIGTGQTDLEHRAPLIWASLQRIVARLEEIR